MGLSILNYDIGNDCMVCFAAGTTPKFIMASFTGISPGDWYIIGVLPPAPNQVFLLEQNPFVPCEWAKLGPIWNVQYRAAGPIAAVLRVGWFGGPVESFVTLPHAECTFAYENNIKTPVNSFYWGGKGQIAWV